MESMSGSLANKVRKLRRALRAAPKIYSVIDPLRTLCYAL